MAVVLFDIDGTLIRTGGAGSRAMNRAFHDLFGIASAFDGIPMAGRTDRWIIDAAVAQAGLSLDNGHADRFRDRYFSRLAEALPEPGPDKGILPGVQALLDAVAMRADVFPALLTGNCESGARIKLEYFDLWRYFPCGAYGDDTHDRNALFEVAMRRVAACGGPKPPPREVIVVGDTEHDIACAKAAGARSVGVATGTYNADRLRASGADVVVDTLDDVGGFMALL